MGFRPGRGCHDALRVIKRNWQNVTWIISIDISKYFDTIHHGILIELLTPYCDQATKELIGKLLKANYVDISNLADSVERRSAGTPQGSLISPILANLYLHELDVYVAEKLIPK
jgi:RNA-directed DNA polymerase